MSRMEVNKGVMRPINNIEEVCKSLNITYTSEEDMRDKLFDADNGKYVEVGDQWYEVDWEINGGDSDGHLASVSKDPVSGEVTFHTLHYNGGAHWTEVVEWELRNKGHD